MSRFVVRWGEFRVRLDPWDTLDDLREITRCQCTPANFETAVAVMGNDPYSVASYLCRHRYITLERKSVWNDLVQAASAAEDMEVPMLAHAL